MMICLLQSVHFRFASSKFFLKNLKNMKNHYNFSQAPILKDPDCLRSKSLAIDSSNYITISDYAHLESVSLETIFSHSVGIRTLALRLSTLKAFKCLQNVWKNIHWIICNAYYAQMLCFHKGVEHFSCKLVELPFIEPVDQTAVDR